MPDAAEFRPSLIPAKPGVYLYRDAFGKVIYVGKAADLRRRMSSYFQASRQHLADAKLRSLIHSIAQFEFHVVRSDDEALILESKLIREYMPRYNVLMRDDKRFQLIRIDLNTPFPKVELCRIQRNDGARYFGPFPHGAALRETVIFLTRHFRLRSCRAEIPDADTYKHCLAAVVKDCTCPCVGKVTPEAYRTQAEALMAAITGSIAPLTADIETRMKSAAGAKNFELAARLRDVNVNLQTVFGKRSRNFRYAKIPAMTEGDAVRDLQESLSLSRPPNLIEGFDNSHMAGHFPVSSMVCFVNGKAATSRYRRFKLRTAIEGYPDDYAAMKEVLTRHYSRKIAENQPMPDLVLIDGGIGQLHTAMKVFETLGIPWVPLASLAERQEEIFLPGREGSILLERHSPALRLLQSVRDEAHRFAVNYNRELRNQRLQESVLDSIEGIGEIRKIKILSEFGSIRELRKADAATLRQRIPGIGSEVAERIVRTLKRSRTPRSIPLVSNEKGE